MSSEDLLAGWTPRRIGREVRVVAETTSTNQDVLASAATAPDGLVILADYQTSGRGRHGRNWVSPRGASILASALLITSSRDRLNAGAELDSGALTLAAGVGACEAVAHATDLTPSIKWPNDLRIGARKLAGILIESTRMIDNRTAYAIGVGINCLQHEGHFPAELRGQATSLDMETDQPIDRMAVARSLLESWDAWIPRAVEGDLETIHASWMKYAEPIGRRVRLRTPDGEIEGTTFAVDPAGGLIVQHDDGRREWFDPFRTTVVG